MFIANATGCSSIWGASAPATPYTKNKKGYGPAWQNSLFEDNAEFGLGMALGQKAIRNRLIEYVEGIQKDTDSADLKTACQNYLDTVTDSTSSRPATDALIAELEKNTEDAKVGELVKKTLVDKDELAKKSMWIFGGDGWAYDIGFGGLDHVIASGENVNILVFDTEVYSNTGGQASKATPVGSVAQFAAAGKAVKKKDLAAIAMSYGYVYVAQCAMGADNNQVLKAMVEAESYNGPSLVICYAPCINTVSRVAWALLSLRRKRLLRQATGTSSVTILVLQTKERIRSCLTVKLLLHHIVTSSWAKFVITHSLVHSPKEQKNSLKRLKRLLLISMLTLKSLQAFPMPNNFG